MKRSSRRTRDSWHGCGGALYRSISGRGQTPYSPPPPASIVRTTTSTWPSSGPRVNLEEQRVCNPDLGCGFVAGWGISGASLRPGFGWFFGGDAAMNTLAMDVTGQWDLVAEDLLLPGALSARGRQDPTRGLAGRRRIDWFERVPLPLLPRRHHALVDDRRVAVLEGVRRRRIVCARSGPRSGRPGSGASPSRPTAMASSRTRPEGWRAVEVGEIGAGVHQDVYLASSVDSGAPRPCPTWPARWARRPWPKRAAELGDLARTHAQRRLLVRDDAGISRLRHPPFRRLRTTTSRCGRPSGRHSACSTRGPCRSHPAQARRGCHLVRLGRPHALVRQRRCTTPAVQQRHRLAVRDGLS